MIRDALAALLLLPASILAQTPGPAATAGSGTATAATAEETWQIDTAHSELAFNLRLFAGRAHGRFDAWSGTITMPADNKWNEAAVNVTVQAASVDTKNKRRDHHLRSPDFFDVEKYPVITFTSTNVKRDGDSIAVAGNLTIKNVTKSVVLKGKFLGAPPGPTPRMNFQATATINRLDYGVNYDNILTRDGIVLGEDVTIDVTLALTRQ